MEQTVLLSQAQALRAALPGRVLPTVLEALADAHNAFAAEIGQALLAGDDRRTLRQALDEPEVADWNFWTGTHVGHFNNERDDHVWHPPVGHRQDVDWPTTGKTGYNLTADNGDTLGYVPKPGDSPLPAVDPGVHLGYAATLSPTRHAILWVLPGEAFLETMHWPTLPGVGEGVRTAVGLATDGHSRGAGLWFVRR